jgi:hypothetical protein
MSDKPEEKKTEQVLREHIAKLYSMLTAKDAEIVRIHEQSEARASLLQEAIADNERLREELLIEESLF